MINVQHRLPWFLLLYVLWLMGSSTVFAQTTTVSGYVQDAESGEKLIGANLFVPSLAAGTITNAYGFFSLTLPGDSASVRVSYIGYRTTVVSFTLAQDLEFNINLPPLRESLDAVEVVAEREELLVETSQMSKIDVPIVQIKTMPALLGEVDVLKSLQLLPGIQSGNEGSTGLYVRGGGPDQNLILLDGAPVYNASHLFGFFSVFNADAIRNVSLTKGGFPARYGGRLSSVVDINLKEGNLKEYRGEAAIGLVASRFTFEGPIQKDRSSFILSARRTYIDILARPIIALSEEEDVTAGYYFYDVNAKVNHIFSNDNRIFLSLYAGNDKFYAREKTGFDAGTFSEKAELDSGLDWGNITATLRWNHVFSNKLFSNSTLTFSRYQFDIDVEEQSTLKNAQGEQNELYAARYFSGIQDWSAKIDLDYIPTLRHYIRFGGSAIHHTFKPGASQIRAEITGEIPIDNTFRPSDEVQAVEWAAFVEDDAELTRSLKINLGVHVAGLAVNGTSYASVQPRLAARWLVHPDWSLKGSYVRMTQFIHLLTNSGVGLPTDLWLPATDRVKPQEATQYALGLAHTRRDLNISVEGYYKNMSNLIEYKEGASFLGLDTDWQDNIETGDGVSYGMELFVQKKKGRTTGWIGYTLSWTERTFPNLNFGRTFDYRYDRRHDFSLVVAHQWKPNIDLSATWVYGTGNAITLPLASYQTPIFIPGTPPGDFLTEGNYYGQRNGFRMAAYHRLDMSINFRKPLTKGERVWSIGVYNAYSRRNPFYISLDTNFDAATNGSERVFKQISLFPVIPSVSYRRSF